MNHWKLAVVAGLCAIACAPASAESADRTIKIVSFARGPYSVVGLSPMEYLKVMYESCKLSKSSAAPFPASLTEAYLEKNFGTRKTDVYQGDSQSSFSVEKLLYPDLQKNCEIMQESFYVAKVEVDCVAHWVGRSSGKNPMAVLTVESGKNACFSKGKTAADMDWVLSRSKIIPLQDDMKCLMPEMGGEHLWALGGIKSCLHPKTPYYMNNPGRPVNLVSGTLAAAQSNMHGSVIEEIVDGDTKVPPSHFTKEAIAAWIKQAALVGIE